MESPILKRIAEFLQEQKKHKQWRAVFIILAVFVGVGTVTALRMMGLAMTHKERVLHCQFQLHEHEKSCYDRDKNLICGYADYVVHKHNDDCYNADLKLVCSLPEVEKHEHTKECYNKTVTLVCGQEETAGHEHTDQCYTNQKGDLNCKKPEHSHTDACYDEEHNLICGMEEHQHDDNCYKWEDVLTCKIREGEGGHTHSDECYVEQEGLTCGQLEMHTHTDKCFEKIDKNGNDAPENLRLVCGKIQLEEHIHTEAAGCLETVEAAPGEVSQEPEAADETAGSSEEGEIFSTDLNGEKTEGQDADVPEGEDGETADGEDGSEAGEETEGEENSGNGEAAEGGEDSETDEEGEAGTNEEAEGEAAADPETYEESKTYEGLGYIVTASYNKDANIPEDARLIAEQITEITDSEDYKKHETEFKKSMGDENATMSALFKIGFYVEGEEVEPETPVLVTIQFVDKNGLPEGEPIKVVHFGDEKTEVIDGGKAESGSTSFKTNGFSKFAVGFSKKDETDVEKTSVQIAESFEYEDAAFHITFHVEGEAVPLEKGEKDKKEDIASEETLTLVNGGEKSKEVEEENEQPKNAGKSGNLEAAEESVKGNSEAAEEESVKGNSDAAENKSSKKESSEAAEAKFSEEFSEEAEEELSEKKLEFKIEHFEKNSQEYKAAIEDAAETNDGSELLFAQVFSYAMYYDGVELDLSECKITAEVKAADSLSAHIEESVPEAVGYLRTEGNIADEAKSEKTDGLQAEETDEYQTEITLDIVEIEDKQVAGQIDSAILSEKKTNASMSFAAPRRMAARATGTPNPHFTVQYYANLNVMSKTGSNALPVIDTNGRKLPQNGKGKDNSPNENAIKNIYVDNHGNVQTTPQLTKVYESRPFEYYKAPSMNYMNALVENPNYTLKEVWVLKEQEKLEDQEDSANRENSVNREDWIIYPYNAELHFTNRELSASEGYVYIKDNAVLRFVYDVSNDDNAEFAAALYDYDIGDGFIYSSKTDAQGQNNAQKTSMQGDGTWYMHTGQSGINSSENYTGEGAKLAFGNANTGTGLQHEMWQNGSADGKAVNNLLNKYNGKQDDAPAVKGSYMGCTFGLVTGLNDGKIQYAPGVIAPNLFNDGDAVGKTAYNDSLTFKRRGDTYTLSSVMALNGLESFGHPGTHTHIWTNNFWPMDTAASYGSDGHDMKFGNYVNRSKRNYTGQEGVYSGAVANAALPYNDDNLDHNSYFGMQYQVQFELTADYVGPLEYYFFGDDDMWVFLGDGAGKNGSLVCDIGGTHSSVGEYINLWDYIDKEAEKIHRHTEACYTKGENEEPTCGYVDSKKFTLHFYYTERGASGSTCWMQFTLPSVSSLTPQTSNKDYGNLLIKKTVNVKIDGKEYPVADYFKDNEGEAFKQNEFTFKLTLTGPSGPLADDYAYVKYDRDGKVLPNGGGVLSWETIANGEDFTLKDGEYIRVQYLPAGSKYTVTETGGTTFSNVVYYGTDMTADDKKPDGSITEKSYVAGTGEVQDPSIDGVVPTDDISDIHYINKYEAYELPETGGSGIMIYTIAGVLCILLGAGFMYTKKAKERRV